jgi:hypothetical protein
MPIIVLLGVFVLYSTAVATPADIEHGRQFWNRWEKVLLILTIAIWGAILFT